MDSHTHKYAGSSSAGGSANSAVKLDTATAGSATQPCYFSGGKLVKCSYTLGKSVPSNAVFTDTVPAYTYANLAKSSAVSSVEWARYHKWGSIVIFTTQFNSGSVTGNETVLFTGLPKPAAYIRSVGIAQNGNDYFPVKLGVSEKGEIVNAYTNTSNISNRNICFQGAYIS